MFCGKTSILMYVLHLNTFADGHIPAFREKLRKSLSYVNVVSLLSGTTREKKGKLFDRFIMPKDE